MTDICNFIPQKDENQSLQFLHFVYETGVKRLPQPFLKPSYCMYLVDKGCAVFQSGDMEARLKKGDLFFTFPYQSYTLSFEDDFTFLYISFNGARAPGLLKDLGISEDDFLFENFDHELQFWMDSIVRVHPGNAYLLTESVFTHTLSYLNDVRAQQNHKEKIDFVLEYINHNYQMADMSIKKVAGIFFYNEKYLSALFVQKTGVKFSQYVTALRIGFAKKLMEEGEGNIATIADQCGYSDRFYFSKVFKSVTGISPTQYIAGLEAK